jgi:sialate O-acetylesterase
LREAQALTARAVPNCGLAITIDTGEADNIHPKEKKPVGERLALLALARVYGKSLVSEGPVYRTSERVGNAMRIHFDHTDGGLKLHAAKPEEFSVAGADRQWRWADARIDGDDIVVSSADVPAPIAVRYAWQSNPKATLFNGAGLPAAPFRTDDWAGVTDHAEPW